MLSFELKIVWFTLSLTGTLACLIVLWAFVRVLGAKWLMVYGIGNVMLQGIFCLGMIYRMDPYLMPRSFCIAQSIIISFSALLLAGVGFSFSLATGFTALKPKTWGDGGRALRWKNVYYAPIVAFPVIGSVLYIVCLFKFDSVQPSDDMHCDSSSPEWVRLLSYAGVAIVMSLPSLYLSVISIHQIYKTNKHLQRARTDAELTSLPRKSRSMRSRTTNIHASHRNHHSGSKSNQFDTFSVPQRDDSDKRESNMFHLPFRTTSGSQFGWKSNTATTESDVDRLKYLAHDVIDDSSSQVSVSFPTFARPSGITARGTMLIEERRRTQDSSKQEKENESENENDSDVDVELGSANVGSELELVSERGADKGKMGWESESTRRGKDGDNRDLHVHTVDINIPMDKDGDIDGRLSDSVIDESDWGGNEQEDKVNTIADVVIVDGVGIGLQRLGQGKDEYMMDDVELEHYEYQPQAAQRGESVSDSKKSVGNQYRKSKEPPTLAPAVWRIILFQVAFISVQFLTAISTIIDLATNRSSPTPLGTQHFALLLAAWGPVLVFGHLPSVRRNLLPWRPILIS